MYRKSKLSVASCQLPVVGLWLVVSVLAWAGVALPAQEAKKLKNPEPKNAETLEAGKKLYARHCASCHGPQGKGDGGMALAGGAPSDLTDETWDYGSTDGEIFTAIRDGVSADMLAYKDKLNDQQIWQVVAFIRSLAPKAKDEKP